MNKAVCYLRIGPQEHEPDEKAMRAQEASISAYCRSVSLDAILTVRDDRVAGAIPLTHRLGGRDLLKVVESGGVGHVVIWKLDRLFRSADEILLYLSAWTALGLTLHVTDMGGAPIQSDTEEGEIFRRTTAELAVLEPSLTSERTRTDIALKKSNRFSYGVTPYGYDLVGNQLNPNPVEQEVLAQVRTWRENRWSLRKIADELNRTGVATKQVARGGRQARWYASTVRYLLGNTLHEEKNGIF